MINKLFIQRKDLRHRLTHVRSRNFAEEVKQINGKIDYEKLCEVALC